MGFGVSSDLLDVLTDQIYRLVSSSAFIYVVGVVFIGLFVVQIFAMFRESFSALGVSTGVDVRSPGYDARVTMFGQKIWGRSELMLDDLKNEGFINVGRRSRTEDFVYVDENGVQHGDAVTVEFYERIKK